MFKFFATALLLVLATNVIAQEPLGLDEQCGTIRGTVSVHLVLQYPTNILI